MTGFFQQYLQMALAGSLVLVVLLFARLLLKRMPKRFMCFLWMIALFRLLCPYTIEGPVPKFWEREASIEDAGQADTEGVVQRPVTVREPLREQQMGQDWRPGDVMQGDSSPDILEPGNETVEKEPLEEEPLKQEVVDASEEKPSEGVEITPEGEREPGNTEALTHATQNLMEYLFLAAAYVWIIGSLCMAVFLAWKYIRTGSALRESTPLTTRRGIGVRQSDFPGVPMVFGIFQPCIYVPYGFDCEKEQMILEHERVHIRHGDTLCKMLSHIALCVHWWNPLVWLGVSLFHKDMEMACDEAVLEQLTGEGRAEYSRMLLQYAAKRSGLALPMGFGESNTEERIRNILGKKKLPVWGTGLAFVLVVALGICIATKPHEPKHGGEEQPTQAEGSGTSPEIEWNDGRILCASGDDFKKIFEERWKKRLREEGLEGEAEALFAWRTPDGISWEAMELDQRMTEDCAFYFCTLTEQGDIKIYQTRANIYRTGEGYVGEDISEELCFDRETQQGKKNLPEFEFCGLPFGDAYPTDQEYQYYWMVRKLIDEIHDRYQKTNPARREALKEPLSAIRELLGFTGEGDYFLGDLQRGTVYWTEEIGGQQAEMIFTMECKGGYWFPILVCFSTHDSFAENYQWYLERKKTWNKMEALDRETLERESVSYDEISSFDDTKKEYILLGQKEDVFLYSARNEEALIVRDNNGIYLFPTYCAIRRGASLYVGDFDGDNSREYIIQAVNKTGTECYGTELLVVEPIPGKEKEPWRERANLYRCTDENWLKELSNRVTYEVHNQVNRISIYSDGFYHYLIDYSELAKEWEKEGKKVNIDSVFFGDMNGFSCVDGQWYLEIIGGIDGEETPVLYDYGVRGVCPVYFGEDGTVSFGEFWFDEDYARREYWNTTAEEYEKMHVKETVVATRSADVNQDGTPELIVVSVTGDESRGDAMERLAEWGEICRLTWNGGAGYRKMVRK